MRSVLGQCHAALFGARDGAWSAWRTCLARRGPAVGFFPPGRPDSSPRVLSRRNGTGSLCSGIFPGGPVASAVPEPRRSAAPIGPQGLLALAVCHSLSSVSSPILAFPVALVILMDVNSCEQTENDNTVQFTPKNATMGPVIPGGKAGSDKCRRLQPALFLGCRLNGFPVSWSDNRGLG